MSSDLDKVDRVEKLAARMIYDSWFVNFPTDNILDRSCSVMSTFSHIDKLQLFGSV